MNSQKLEDILNLSLDSTPEERLRSGILNVGYEPEEQTWELIVKFHGDLARIASEEIQVEVLLAGYAIVTIPERMIPALTALEEVEYVEKPKQLLYGSYTAKQESCILSVERDGLSGEGCLVAVLDSGIDYYLDDFRNPDGSTRISWLWDQTLPADERKRLPEGFFVGTEFSEEQINEALRTGSREAAFELVPSRDLSGHGTSVAAIAAGSNPRRELQGVATGSRLIVVKLGNRRESGFPRTTEMMRAVAYVLKKAQEMGMPVAINMSFGNNYGAHDGSSLLERFLDNASEVWKNVVCVGSGNEGAASGHVSGNLTERQQVEVVIGSYERTLSIQIWKNYADLFGIRLRAPSGKSVEVEFLRDGSQSVVMDGTTVLIYAGEPAPYSVHQEIFFDLIPVGAYVAEGVWTVEMEPRKIVSGSFQMYLPGLEVRSAETRFVRPDPSLTLTIPSTAQKVITVGASQTVYDAYADFSGRGQPAGEAPGAIWRDTKPDLIAPGTNLRTAAAGGGVREVTGTSFATPLVCGSCALLMEWGIVKGNDPYLYGEKVKAWLRRGARPLRGEERYPNERSGYGALCLEESLPGGRIWIKIKELTAAGEKNLKQKRDEVLTEGI